MKPDCALHPWAYRSSSLVPRPVRLVLCVFGASFRPLSFECCHVCFLFPPPPFFIFLFFSFVVICVLWVHMCTTCSHPLNEELERKEGASTGCHVSPIWNYTNAARDFRRIGCMLLIEKTNLSACSYLSLGVGRFKTCQVYLVEQRRSAQVKACRTCHASIPHPLRRTARRRTLCKAGAGATKEVYLRGVSNVAPVTSYVPPMRDA